MSDTIHEVYAVKFADNPNGTRGTGFHGSAGEPHDESVPLDYFVWLIRSTGSDVVLDVGFTAETARRRDRVHYREPSEGLQLLGVDPASVETVILSHFHYDHTGDLDAFPRARFVVQEAEMAFWTGPYGPRREFAKAVEPRDLGRLLQLNYEGRLRFVDGHATVSDGIDVFAVGGHTPGLQVTRVRTAKGPVLLAADGAHFYANYEQEAPFAVFTDLRLMYRSYQTMKDLVNDPTLIVPGHDPLVFERFPTVEGLDGIAIRIA
ncbi:MAG: N-acyl homoserine lactonase family protein [Frondihabitans sp.]|nr:N-acyl homoserine lactonase family protein [Frondihabitans sp.]